MGLQPRLEVGLKPVTLMQAFLNQFHKKIRLNQPSRCVILGKRFYTCPLDRERCCIFLKPALSSSKSMERTLVRFLKIHSDRLPRSTIKHQEGLKRLRCLLLQLRHSPCAFRSEENKKWCARNGACSWKSTLKPREVLAKPPVRCPVRQVTASTMPGSAPNELVKCAMKRAPR